MRYSRLSAQISFAQCNETLSDTSFPGALVFFSSAQSGPPFPDYGGIEISRVVGPGISSDFDGSGFLTPEAWNLYVQNGVLSPKAYLGIGDILTIDVGPANGDIVGVYVNDIHVGTYVYPALPDCIEISTQYLKFPQRVPGQAAQSVENKVSVTIDFSVDRIPEGEAILVGPLTLKAMAPVIMVHGWHSGPWFWGPSPSAAVSPGTQDACGTDGWYPTHGGYEGGFNFIQPFISAKIPFDCSLAISPIARVADGAAALEPHILSTAGEFGAQHVHLIGHSLGGLWVRGALPKLKDDTMGVYSVTTIDTPHHGSSLADLLVLAHKHPLLGFSNPRLFLGLLRGYDPGADDLQTSAAAGINSQYPDPTNIQYNVNGVTNYAQYFSVAADADLDMNGSVNAEEGCPYPHAGRLYNFLRSIQSVSVTPVVTIAGKTIIQRPVFNTTAPQKNDLAVTVASAQFDGFNPIAPPAGVSGSVQSGPCTPTVTGFTYSGSIPYFPGNHKTVSSPSLGSVPQSVLQNIQTADSEAQPQ